MQAEQRVSRELEKAMAYQARCAKRARKPERMRAIVDKKSGKTRAPPSSKRRHAKAASSALTAVGARAVQRHRHGPDDLEFKSAKRSAGIRRVKR